MEIIGKEYLFHTEPTDYVYYILNWLTTSLSYDYDLTDSQS